MKLKRLLSSVCCITLAGLMLFSAACNNGNAEEGTTETDAPRIIDLSELNGYKIIRNEFEERDTVVALLDFRMKLKEQYKLDVTLALDVESPADTKEIIIGETNRATGVNHRYSDYSVAYDDGRILINGGSAAAVSAAIDWFCNECISDGKLYVSKMPYEYNATYSMESLKINGVALKDFAFENLNADAASEIYNWIGPKVGMRKAPSEGYVIKLVEDASLYLDEITAKLDGKALVLSSSACLNDLSIVTDYFKDKIENRKSDNVKLDGKATVELPEPPATVKDVREVNGSSKMVYAVTDKDPLEYVVGDDVVFSCTLYSDKNIVSCPKFSWTANTEDGKSYSGTADGAHGKLVVKIPATASGIVRLKVLALDEKGQLISGIQQSRSFNEPCVFSAVVNAKNINTKASEPADFDEFWNAQIANLDAVAPDVIFMEKLENKNVENVDGGSSKPLVDIYRLKIKTPDDCGYASAYLTIPRGADPNSLGIVVFFHGYNVGDITPQASDHNMVLTVSAHSIELNQPSSYYSNLSSGELSNYGFKNNNSRDTCYFRTMILRDLQAVRFIKAYGGTEGVKINGETQSLGLWNGKLRLQGGSQGAFQGIAVAAFDKDVTDAKWSIPWMCDVKGMKSEFRPAYTSALGYYDSVYFGKRISADVNVTISAGLGDYICPPSGVVALYNQMSAHVTLTFDQGMTHGFYPPNAAVYKYSK